MTIFGLNRQSAQTAETGVTSDAGSDALEALDAMRYREPDRQPGGLGAEARLRAIVEQQPACLTEVAADGRVLAMNAAQVALLGTHTVGRCYKDLVTVTDRERVDTFIRQVTQGQTGSLEYLMVMPGGLPRDVVTDAVPLERGSGHGVVALMVTRDLTEYRALEQQLWQLSEDHKHDCAQLSEAHTQACAHLSEAHQHECAQLEARIQASEERERTLVAQRDEERRRVGLALERARTQLVELKAVRNPVTHHDLSGNLGGAPSGGPQHAVAGV